MPQSESMARNLSDRDFAMGGPFAASTAGFTAH